MSCGTVCQCLTGGKQQRDEARKTAWEVTQRRCNHSSFNGNRYTVSRYSCVRCKRCGACWRTMASYVNLLPDRG